MEAAFLAGSIFQRQTRRTGQPFRDALDEAHQCDCGEITRIMVEVSCQAQATARGR